MPEAKTHQTHHSSTAYLPIEDYAPIGDLHTVALVGKNGSIDWCCLPRFDSPSVFGALLDAGKGGFFRIAPADDVGIKCKQMYLPQTNVLLTRFLSTESVGELTDFMVMKGAGTAEQHHRLIRSVTVVHGSLTFALACQPGFDYARDSHRVEVSDAGAFFQSTSLCLSLASPLPLEQNEQGGVKGKERYGSQYITFDHPGDDRRTI
jgi:GH15 family glucan-1,4-alpha-glucosidase